MMERYSDVIIRGVQEKKKVMIASTNKPEIDKYLINKWQGLIDTCAKIINVPSALIMILNEDTIEVFMKSNTEGNPYKVGEKAELVYGLYCETVIGKQEKLLVPDATRSPLWKTNNPDIDINMISYLGVPLNWPDGETFGTVCVLDNKENNYSPDFEEFVSQVRRHIEVDLNVLLSKRDLENSNKTKSKFLSLISHDIRGNIGSVDAILQLIIDNIDNFNKESLVDLLETTKKSTSKTYTTLEDLLFWSKNEISHIEPKNEEFDLVEMFNELIEYFDSQIRYKKLKLITDYKENKAIIFADKNMITTSFRNILSNAVKYTPDGGVVSIKISPKKDKQEVVITDNGIGMKKENVCSLFSYDKYHCKSGTSGEHSAGIGLLLVKEFLDKNNAEIIVDSELRKGTSFSILI